MVRLQLEIADGKRLPFGQADVQPRGHAVEARLYAEDPSRDFLPSAGVLHRFATDQTVPVRYDSGVESGSIVSPQFDGLLAKAIAHAEDRSEAIARLARSLRGLQVHGVRTNRDALVAILESEPFAEAEISTELLEQHPELLSACVPEDVVLRHAVAAALELRRQARELSPLPFVPPGWRNVPSAEPVMRRFAYGERIVEAPAQVNDYEIASHSAHIVDTVCYVNDRQWQTEFTVVPRFADSTDEAASGSTLAPLPGTVSAVLVNVGQQVTEGQSLVVLDAMKIEHHVVAPSDGTVREVRVQPGDKVDAHQVLVVLE
jgi:propionyl-CoA carboxylase alpha chain